MQGKVHQCQLVRQGACHSCSSTKKNMHCRNIEQCSNLLTSLGEACTSPPTQPSPCGCSPSLLGENVNAPSSKNSSHIEGKRKKLKLQERQPDPQHSKVKLTSPQKQRRRPEGLNRHAPSAPASSRRGRICTIPTTAILRRASFRAIATLRKCLSQCLPPHHFRSSVHCPDRITRLPSGLLLLPSTQFWPCNWCLDGEC